MTMFSTERNALLSQPKDDYAYADNARAAHWVRTRGGTVVPVTSPGDMIVPADRVVNAVNVREAPTTASALVIQCASEVVDSHTIAQIENDK